MKVVLFCGGLGMRLRDHAESIPKPLVCVGDRPILWHVMRYYAHFGHTDFILCLGYKAECIREYFLTQDHVSGYNITVNGDARETAPPSGDARDWRIAFVDTGIDSSVGMRLKALEPMLRGEEFFLANYSDGVSDLPLPAMIDEFRRRDAVAIFAGVAPTQSFHLASVAEDGRVHSIDHVKNFGMRVNGGFFVFRGGIFDWLRPGEELVEECFQRLAGAGKLLAYPHDGFWACLDTFKDKQLLEDLYARGSVPWGSLAAPNRRTHDRRVALSRGIMQHVSFPGFGAQPTTILALGAHSDDIEIGCGGTLLRLIEENPSIQVCWVVLGATGEREAEATRSANRFLAGAKQREIIINNFRDGYFPYAGGELKDFFETLASRFSPDLVLTHCRHDLHQDHRLVCELTWNTFRRHLILEYEVVKYDGDLGSPNFFVHLTEELVHRKVRTIMECFASQTHKHWFTEDTFRSILRLRGVESNAPGRFAEAFYGRKIVY